MTQAIVYRHNHSMASDVVAHLAACDDDFVPPLSQRVNLEDYTAKLVRFAQRFEAWAGAELAGLVAAYCNEVATGTAFVSSVSVLPALRGAAIADRLLDECLDHAASLGFRRVELRVAATNASALRLYARRGFRRFGDGDEITLRHELAR